jgi:hypothetical protein
MKNIKHLESDEEELCVLMKIDSTVVVLISGVC